MDLKGLTIRIITRRHFNYKVCVYTYTLDLFLNLRERHNAGVHSGGQPGLIGC